MKRVFREPLLHFLVIASLLFVAYDLVQGGGGKGDNGVIEVSRAELLRHLQYRQKKFDGEQFGKVFASMSQDDIRKLARDYAREEAIYREAKALHLDRDDYVARMRLVQQLEYLVKGSVPSDVEVTEEAIQAYYEEHKSEYYVEPTLTFTHVFVSGHGRSAAEFASVVEGVGKVLKARPADPARAGALGDRFMYHLNYADKSRRELVGHFGAGMVDQLFAAGVNNSAWQGPFASESGQHYVLLQGRKNGYQPPLAEVRDSVEQAFRYQVMQSRYASALQAIVAKYEVRGEFAAPGDHGDRI